MADLQLAVLRGAAPRARDVALEAWPLPGAGDDARRPLPRAGRARSARRLAARTASPRPLDVRSLCLAREMLAYHDGLADFAFAMQGLGRGPISLFGRRAQREQYLPAVAAGEPIAAFALSEPEAGSDVAAMTTTARRDGPGLDGTKTWISNGGIADFYIVFARGPGEGHHGVRRRGGSRGRRSRAHRRDRAAPAGDAALRRTRRASCSASRVRGCEIAMAHARRLPHHGRRGRARVRAPRAGRGARARPRRASCSARRWPTSR